MKNDFRDQPVRSDTFPLAKEGYPLVFSAAFITAVFAMLHYPVPAVTAMAVTFFLAYFFRDPDRVVPNTPGAVVAPADGRIIAVDSIDNVDIYPGRAQKVSIFMSVFNVHINRIPHEGRIHRTDYVPGSFVAASRKNASRDNERNAVLMETDDGHAICVVQVAGLIARRIICKLQSGDAVERGQRFGMICFGSRVDLYLPPEARVDRKVGDRVTGGTSVIGFLPSG
jgi:phosphatidylserine decarboxylase